MNSLKLTLLSLLITAMIVSCSSTAAPTTVPTTALTTAMSTPTAVPSTLAPEPSKVEAKTLTVLAAASLTVPFNELGKLFETDHPGVKVTFSFAGSQQLAQQLTEGARADIFASASQKYMDAIVTAGKAKVESVLVFAENRLVVIFPSSNPGEIKTLADLAKSGLKLDLAASEVPVGKYSLDFLDKAAKDPSFLPQYKEDVLKNVVSYEDNVKTVLTKVQLGEVDAGIVYTSDLSDKSPSQIGRLEIPEELNVIASYPIASLSGSENPALAQSFVDLVMSPRGQQVLASFGFNPIR